MRTTTLKIIIIILISSLSTSCSGFFKYSDARKNPTAGEARAKKNVEEGRGMSIGNAMKNRRGTNYEFSTSNPMWRASLETLDFLPLTTVDYSGGVIISDWYSSDSDGGKESIKISIRFLSNEIRTENLKIIIHKKTCSSNINCKISLISNSKIKQELHAAIIKKAALLEKDSKNKKK